MNNIMGADIEALLAVCPRNFSHFSNGKLPSFSSNFEETKPLNTNGTCMSLSHANWVFFVKCPHYLQKPNKL